MRGYLDEEDYNDLYTYNIDKDLDLEGDEELHSDSNSEYDFIRCPTMDSLIDRAHRQARNNASLLREILPENITVKYCSFVACKHVSGDDDVEFQFKNVRTARN